MKYTDFPARLGGAVLLVTGLSKFLDVTTQNYWFNDSDSVMSFLTNRQVLLLAGALDLGVALYIWLANSTRERNSALLWFCSIVLVYKLGRALTHAYYPCSCLGIIGRLLRLSSKQLDWVSWVIILSLAAASLIGIIWQSRSLRHSERERAR